MVITPVVLLVLLIFQGADHHLRNISSTMELQSSGIRLNYKVVESDST